MKHFPVSPDAGAESDHGTDSVEHISPTLRSLAVPISVLQCAPDNARHRHAVDAIAESLSRHQQQKPVVVKRQYRGLLNVVIAGNGTLLAAKSLGWSHIAVTWFEGSDDDARIYGLLDNRYGELSEFNPEALAAMQADGVDLLAIWRDDAALADLMVGNAPVPRFEPTDSVARLDKLSKHCPSCTCHAEDAE